MTIQSGTITDFEKSYIECALWSSTDEAVESLDTFSVQDISPDTLHGMLEDCAAFESDNADDLHASGLSVESQGHDFWR